MDNLIHAFDGTASPGGVRMPDWRSLFDASPFAALVLTPDLVLLGCNAAHTANSGIPSAAMAGRFMFDVFPKNPDGAGVDAEVTIRASVERVMGTREPDEPPIQRHDLPREDGSFEPRYWRMVHSPIRQDDEVVAIRQDSWDVTAQVLEEERQTALQRVAGSMAGIGFWELDPVTDRLARTPELDVLYGFPSEAGAGEERSFANYFERIHEEDQPVIEAAIGALLSEGVGGVRQLGFRVVRSDGDVRSAIVWAEVVDGPDGRPVLIGITLDVTDLHANEARLASLLEEKEALLGEVNHRVKNSLQLVSAILSLEARKASAEEGTRLRSAAARVQSVAAAHAALYQGGDVRTVEMGVHLRWFCAHLAESLGAKPRGIALTVEADDVRLPAVQAVPLSLIVNELVTNAFKHAFGDSAFEGARVSVSLQSGPEGTHTLIVRDNGRGPGTDEASEDSSPQEAAAGTMPSKGSGLGSQLIATLVRQIGGRIVQEQDGGWTTRIEFGA